MKWAWLEAWAPLCGPILLPHVGPRLQILAPKSKGREIVHAHSSLCKVSSYLCVFCADPQSQGHQLLPDRLFLLHGNLWTVPDELVSRLWGCPLKPTRNIYQALLSQALHSSLSLFQTFLHTHNLSFQNGTHSVPYAQTCPNPYRSTINPTVEFKAWVI